MNLSNMVYIPALPRLYKRHASRTTWTRADAQRSVSVTVQSVRMTYGRWPRASQWRLRIRWVGFARKGDITAAIKPTDEAQSRRLMPYYNVPGPPCESSRVWAVECQAAARSRSTRPRPALAAPERGMQISRLIVVHPCRVAPRHPACEASSRGTAVEPVRLPRRRGNIKLARLRSPKHSTRVAVICGHPERGPWSFRDACAATSA